ncbi:MAG TPA: hypothetical protein VFN35_35855 [Ktedonobacteraceae bacterium]|nr:hypothetical protein [Ktedonobacteraceae bacterium]
MSSAGTARVTAVSVDTLGGISNMSSAGVGTVAAVGALGIVAAGALVVGAGVLIGQGVVWCGQKLEENYQNACKDWTNLANRARTESMQNVQEMQSYMADQWNCTALSAVLTPTASVNPGSVGVTGHPGIRESLCSDTPGLGRCTAIDQEPGRDPADTGLLSFAG